MIDITTYRNRRTGLARLNPRPGERTPLATIIIPAYNEELGLGTVLEQLLEVIDGSYEVIVVDDGSADETSAVASQFPCRVIRHEQNRGKGSAMRTGVGAALSDNIIFIDADDSYPVEAVPLIAKRLQHADLVIGTRGKGREHIPQLNQFGNRAIASLIRVLYGFRETDPLSGLYGLKRESFFRMDLRSPGFAIEAEIALKAARMGLITESIPIEYRERLGESKLSAVQDGYRIGKMILGMLTLYNPTIVFVIPGLILFALSSMAVVALSIGSISIGPVLLSTNSLLAAGMLALSGFEIATFGIALHIYGALHKYVRSDGFGSVLLRVFSSDWLLVVAMSALLSSMSLSLAMFITWSADNFGAFKHTSTLFLGAFMGVFGLQLLLSALFLSPLLEDLRVARSPSVGPIEAIEPVAPAEGFRPEEEAQAA